MIHSYNVYEKEIDMHKFKVGDTVRRVDTMSGSGIYAGMPVGAEDVVTGLAGATLTLAKFGAGHSVVCFELVDTGKRRPHYDLIIAWANGAEIQMKRERDGKWIDRENPAWDPAVEYRIKPDNSAKIAELEKQIENLRIKVAALKEE